MAVGLVMVTRSIHADVDDEPSRLGRSGVVVNALYIEFIGPKFPINLSIRESRSIVKANIAVGPDAENSLPEKRIKIC